MNFSELKTELAARGFDYLSDTRLGRYINWARAELDDTELWPYRLSGVTGPTNSSGAMTTTNGGPIMTVVDTTTDRALQPADERDLYATYGDLTTAGTPQFYYITGTESQTFYVYPVAEITLLVKYWRVTPDLTGTDTPMSPTRFHKLIVDIAARECYRDADNHQAAESLQVQIDRDLWRMRESLLIQQTQGPQSSIQITEQW